MPEGVNSRRSREVTTKDDVSLRELYDEGTRILDIFNNEAEFPFRDLFVEEVGEQMFKQYPPGEFLWEEIAEGEHARTAEMEDPKWQTVSVAKFGRSLGMTQEFIEDHSAEMVTRRFEKLVEGASELQRRHIMDAIDKGIADGREIWYTIDKYGDYDFNPDHNHRFDDTGELGEKFGFSNADEDGLTPTQHVSLALDDIRHHGKGSDPVVLCGAGFKRAVREEWMLTQDYHVPQAENMRTDDLWESDFSIDGANVIQTSWLTGTDFFVVDRGSEEPLKMHEKRPVQLTRPSGGQVQNPSDLIGAYGSGRWGFRMVDPLDAVYVNPDNLVGEDGEDLEFGSFEGAGTIDRTSA